MGWHDNLRKKAKKGAQPIYADFMSALVIIQMQEKIVSDK
jgi:hypothetical protein